VPPRTPIELGALEGAEEETRGNAMKKGVEPLAGAHATAITMQAQTNKRGAPLRGRRVRCRCGGRSSAGGEEALGSEAD
jgi:hypothetical protein